MKEQLPDTQGQLTALREALADYDTEGALVGDDVFQAMYNAARNIALPILEADPELVERIARIVCHLDYADDGVHNFECKDMALAVLAAISTPTPGGQE